MTKTATEAVIDLGTHSALLLIARVDEKGNMEILKEAFNVTRLGKGIGQGKGILPENQAKALDVLHRFKSEIATYGVEQVHVLATEALRQAPNANAFKQDIERTFGWQVKVLSPQEEARFAYFGAISVYDDFTSKRFSVVDVGGGSTEITRGLGMKIEMSRSFPMGALRLAERFGYREKIVPKDIPLLQEILDRPFKEAELKTFSDNAILVGTGGTITTAAAIRQKTEKFDPELINKTSLTLEELLLMFEDLNAKTLGERRQVKGLEAGRETVILYGLIIYIHLLQRSGLWRIKVSARGLRHGFLLAHKLGL